MRRPEINGGCEAVEGTLLKIALLKIWKKNRETKMTSPDAKRSACSSVAGLP